jgi:hypothetical protein
MMDHRLGALAIAGAVIFSFSAHAGDQPQSGRFVNISQKNECTKVEGEKGRIVCAYIMASVGISDDGEMRKRSVVGSLDFTNGEGPVYGTNVSTLPDGSTFTTAWEGESKVDGDKGPVMNGTYRCISGTGRFAGAECKGTWTSKQQKGGFTMGSYKGTLTLPD